MKQACCLPAASGADGGFTPEIFASLQQSYKRDDVRFNALAANPIDSLVLNRSVVEASDTIPEEHSFPEVALSLCYKLKSLFHLEGANSNPPEPTPLQQAEHNERQTVSAQASESPASSLRTRRLRGSHSSVGLLRGAKSVRLGCRSPQRDGAEAFVDGAGQRGGDGVAKGLIANDQVVDR